MSQAIVLLARAPSARGKTRLTAGIPNDKARALREALLLDTLDIARSCCVPVTVCYTPADAHDEIATLVGEGGVAPQRGDDLGARMHHAIAHAFDAGTDDVVLIGSDLPTLPADYLLDAFTLLGVGIDCVFGPADDGGYYLVGVTRGGGNPAEGTARLRPVFTGIPWGTDAVLSETLAAAEAARLIPALVRPWFDVDLPRDLERVAEAPPHVAPRTRAWHASLL